MPSSHQASILNVSEQQTFSRVNPSTAEGDKQVWYSIRIVELLHCHSSSNEHMSYFITSLVWTWP